MKRLLIFIQLSAASILPAWNDIDLTEISCFVYQLQDLDLDAVGASSFQGIGTGILHAKEAWFLLSMSDDP
jgi:hypothetical protein